MTLFNRSAQLWCAHSGLAFALLLGLGIFGIAGWMPLVNPAASAETIAQMFVDNQTRIRIGATVLGIGSVLWWSFAAAIAMQMKRIEGDSHPLAYVQMATASGGILALLLPAYFWLALAFRPDMVPPAVMRLINDWAWLSFIGMFPPGVLQNCVLGACILADKRAEPIYPRWVAYVCFWAAAGFAPTALLPFFPNGGPFAWNGIIGFWVPATAFFGWIVVLWWMTLRAIKRQPITDATT